MKNEQEVLWQQLTLGHLSRNKFWGEDPDTQYHSVVASTTLVKDGDIHILVDPTLPVDETERRLQRYCGLDRNDIDIVFATHYHTDHRLDAEKYPNAKLYMSAESVQDVADVQAEGGFLAKVFLNGAVHDFTAAPRQLTPNVEVVPLPGHTPGLAGLTFSSKGKRILLSGDTIMNPEFYHAREGYFIDASQEKTVSSMNWTAEHVDIIVPGHGDWFFANAPEVDNQKTLTWRRLNLCAEGEETAVLVQSATENIVINPVLSGHLLREGIFDTKGLEPSDITRVICLKSDGKHMLDLPVMKNAQYYLPQHLMGEKAEAFLPWKKTEKMPIDIVRIGESSVCLFVSGEKTIAISSDNCAKQALQDLGVDVAILGREILFLK